MANTKMVTCTVCPVGCRISVSRGEDEKLKVEGNACKRGEAYSIAECTNPTRTLTTTMRIKLKGGSGLLPVRSEKPIPREKLFEAVKIISKTSVNAPIRMGEIVIPNICGVGVDIIASRSVI